MSITNRKARMKLGRTATSKAAPVYRAYTPLTNAECKATWWRGEGRWGRTTRGKMLPHVGDRQMAKMRQRGGRL